MPERVLRVAVVGDNESLIRTFRSSSRETAAFSRNISVAERDLGKATRGFLAGTGAVAGFGRSLAFASGFFIGFAGISSAFRTAVDGAEALQKANDSLGVVIRRANGDVGKQIPLLDAWAKAQERLGVSETDALTGLKQTAVLTGSVQKGMLAYTMGLELARAENLSTTAAMRISAKAILGQTTSLTRYGIILPKTTDAQRIFNAFQARFADQAETNTSAFDRLRAAYSNVATSVGTALLPVFERYARSLADWLSKSKNQEDITRKVTTVMGDAASVIRGLAGVVKNVDRVTGGFGDTLKLLAAFKLASLVSGWIGSLEALAAQWGAVAGAATAAKAAEGGALAGGAFGAVGAGRAAAGGRGSPLPFIVGSGAARDASLAQRANTVNKSLAERISQYTITGQQTESLLGRGQTALRTLGRVGGSVAALIGKGFAIGDAGAEAGKLRVNDQGFVEMSFNGKWYRGNFVGIPGSSAITVPGFLKLGGKVDPFSGLGNLPAGFADASGHVKKQVQGFLAGVKRLKQFSKSFELTPFEQLAQAQAGLTKSNRDDVAAARKVIARIRRLIDEGRLHGPALIQALQAEATALGTVWSAEDAAAQKRAQQAQDARDRLQKQIENQIDPLNLEVALSRAQALGKPFVQILKAMRTSARKALASGKLTLDQQKQAWDQISQLNQQIKDALSGQTQQFQVPAKLALSLARDQALGRDTTKDLLRIRASILKFISTHKKNIAALTDAYNQLADINQQLGQTAQSALGLFKQASTRALTQGLGLTAAQRKELRARLSQLGPGGTTPSQGVGAFGFVINPATDRPIVIHTHVKVRDKEIGTAATRVQQNQRRRNSSQTRGPNAGLAFGF